MTTRRDFLRLAPLIAAGAATGLAHPGRAQAAGAVGPIFLQPPKRVFDSRIGYGGRGKLGAGTRITLGTGQGGPHAAILNVTCTESEAAGFLTVWDGVGPWPGTSNVNFRPGEDVANEVHTLVRGNGAFDVFVNQTTDVVIDVICWYWASEEFQL